MFRTLLTLIKAKLTGQPLEFMKCDERGCYYIEIYDRLTADHIDTPCRNCGVTMMTYDEYAERVVA